MEFHVSKIGTRGDDTKKIEHELAKYCNGGWEFVSAYFESGVGMKNDGEREHVLIFKRATP